MASRGLVDGGLDVTAVFVRRRRDVGAIHMEGGGDLADRVLDLAPGAVAVIEVQVADLDKAG